MRVYMCLSIPLFLRSVVARSARASVGPWRPRSADSPRAPEGPEGPDFLQILGATERHGVPKIPDALRAGAESNELIAHTGAEALRRIAARAQDECAARPGGMRETAREQRRKKHRNHE